MAAADKPACSYAVIAVTYNRLELLKECIGHILDQTVPAYRIIVIDNSSTDGTAEYLDQTYASDPRFVIRHLPSNTGGAGGFCSGLLCAMETDADWFMLIDDDAMLFPDCMEQLAPAPDRPGTLAYACTVWSGGRIDLSHRRGEHSPAAPGLYSKKEFPCRYATFCGLMLHRSLVEKAGYPEKDYFIWFDDSEYSMRITAFSDILVRPAAGLDHRAKNISSHQILARTSWKRYYGVRNSLHAYRKHRKYAALVMALGRYTALLMIKLLLGLVKDRGYLGDARLYADAVCDALKGRLGRNKAYLPGA